MKNGPFCVGFAAESEKLAQHAKEKRAEEEPSLAGRQSGAGPPSEPDTNSIVLYDDRGEHPLGTGAKLELARNSSSTSPACCRKRNEEAQVKVLDERGSAACCPHYATAGAAGMDLRACIDAPLTLHAEIATWCARESRFHLGDPGYVAMILPRSGLASKHGIVLGIPGRLDRFPTIRAKCWVSVWNRGKSAFTIQPLDRIAQLVVVPVGPGRVRSGRRVRRQLARRGRLRSTGR